MILKKLAKYLTIIIIYILFLFLLSAFSVSKASVEFTYNDVSYSPVLPENFSSFVISYCNDGKFWLNGINNDNVVSALYGLHSVGHYIRFLDSSGSALSVEKRYYSTDCQNWTLRDTGTDGLVRNSLTSICYSNIDIYDVDGNLYYSGEPKFKNPYILNSAEDLASGSFDDVLIESGDFDLNEGDLYLHTLSPSYNNPSINAYYFTDKVFRLSAHNIYYKEYNYKNDIYISYFSISIGDLGIDFKNGNTYYFILNDSSSNLGGAYDTDSPTFSSSYDCRRFTISGLTADDIEYNRHNENIFAINNQTLSIQTQTNAINNQTSVIQGQTSAINNQTTKIEEQTNKIEEQTTVNRGIWGTLQSVLNFINPFSEDFFVYKLIDLLVNALKSLFVPSDGFFNNWLSDLNTYFGDVFGILYYPFEILIDFLTRIGNIQSTEPIINIPRFELNFMGYSAVLFDSFSYNFNDLLTTDTFKNIHTIYLSVVDIILWLSVVYLASKCLQSIFGGMSDVVIDDSLEGERSYQAYSRYENNKKRYKNEH